MSKQEDLRKRVFKFYEEHQSKGKKFTVDHFKAESEKGSTLYRVIQRMESGISYETLPGRGRKASIMNKKGVKRLKGMFDHKDGISYRQAARKFNCDYGYVGKTLKNKLGIKSRKKIKIPKRNDSSYLREKKVNFVEKSDNPANVPEARPIENLWANLKRIVYKNNWQADNLDQLKSRIEYCWNKLAKDDPELVKRLIMTVRQKVGFIHRNGVIEDR
jgi:hypothetical protein